MIIKEARLEGVAVKESQYPLEDKIEIAFVGRSNVGKSSLLNLLTGRKNLARISQTPGKTRTINFYEINGEFRIVDLPGYGYAKISKEASKDWEKMITTYLEKRQVLKKVIQLVDIRHVPTSQDIQMREYLRHFNLAGPVVATKSDKVSRNELNKALGTIRKTLSLDETEKVFPVSALKREGVKELMEELYAIYNF